MSISLDSRQRKTVDEMTAHLRGALGDRLIAAVLYGTATQGERADDRELALLLVVKDLSLATLAALAEPFSFWRRKGLPIPRIFSPALLESSRDVFPIELMDLTAHREIIVGADPIDGLTVDNEHLRIQCEREISEKLMRLREAYASSSGNERALRRLLNDSFPVFTQVLRGALRLLGQAVPDRGVDVARAFCQATKLDPAPFVEVDAMRHGTPPKSVAALFGSYYEVLEQTAAFIDRHVVANATVTQQGASS